MLPCELCENQAKVAVLPIVGEVAPDDVIFAQEVGYTCLECALDLMERGHAREMPLEDHNALCDLETGHVGNDTGWIHAEEIYYASAHR